MPNELAKHESRPAAIAPVNVADLLHAIVKTGVTADSALAVKELVLLSEHQEERQNKQLWLEAFTRVREKLKTPPAMARSARASAG